VILLLKDPPPPPSFFRWANNLLWILEIIHTRRLVYLFNFLPIKIPNQESQYSS